MTGDNFSVLLGKAVAMVTETDGDPKRAPGVVLDHMTRPGSDGMVGMDIVSITDTASALLLLATVLTEAAAAGTGMTPNEVLQRVGVTVAAQAYEQ